MQPRTVFRAGAHRAFALRLAPRALRSPLLRSPPCAPRSCAPRSCAPRSPLPAPALLRSPLKASRAPRDARAFSPHVSFRSPAPTRRAHDTTSAGTPATYPNAPATAKHASTSRSDPSADRYRSRRIPPTDPEPSPMFNTTLAAARRNCRPKSRSAFSISPMGPRRPRIISTASSWRGAGGA